MAKNKDFLRFIGLIINKIRHNHNLSKEQLLSLSDIPLAIDELKAIESGNIEIAGNDFYKITKALGLDQDKIFLFASLNNKEISQDPDLVVKNLDLKMFTKNSISNQ